MLNYKINKYKTQIINNVYLNILISFFKFSIEYYIYTCFTCDFEHIKLVVANFTKQFLPLIVKELFILDHSSNLKTQTILIKLLSY